MRKEILIKSGILLMTGLTLSASFTPLTIFATEVSISSKDTQSISAESDIKEQFNLSESYVASINKIQTFIPTKEQLEQINQIYDTGHGMRVIGIDDVLELIAIAGVGYAAGHWAGAEAHKRFGLTAASYKKNRWWWRAGIAAVAGIPAALGFDDYFYGI